MDSGDESTMDTQTTSVSYSTTPETTTMEMTTQKTTTEEMMTTQKMTTEKEMMTTTKPALQSKVHQSREFIRLRMMPA